MKNPFERFLKTDEHEIIEVENPNVVSEFIDHHEENPLLARRFENLPGPVQKMLSRIDLETRREIVSDDKLLSLSDEDIVIMFTPADIHQEGLMRNRPTSQLDKNETQHTNEPAGDDVIEGTFTRIEEDDDMLISKQTSSIEDKRD